MLRVFRKFIGNRAETVPRKPLGPFHTDVAVYRQPPATGVRITWLGHSSMLLEIDRTTILIDPVWSQRASLVQWAGPKRFFAPPLAIADLPPLDAVLLSHDHYDHLDSAAVAQLVERTPIFVCSLGVGEHLRRWGVPAVKIRELGWMDTFSARKGLEITALPARHFSGRGLKRFRTLWSSFALESAHHRIYHGADSGYYEGFREIGEHFAGKPYGDGGSGRAFDLATLEIGAFDPLWEQIHLGPENAAKAFHELRAGALMPIHWGLFNLALHAWDAPIEQMLELAKVQEIPLFLPTPGVPMDFDANGATEPASALPPWWRSSR